VTSRGICYSTSQNPTTSTNCANSGNGVGAFTAAITGLTANSTYYTRSYATNSTGTSYGNQVQFTTTPTVTDIDGNVYQTVQIESQLWLASNLRTSRYRNGSTIENVVGSSTWGALFTGAWVNYDNIDNLNYGKLYNWYAVSNSAGLCPTGWHVPSDNEWLNLHSYLGSDAGTKMKSNEGWINNQNGLNSSGFNGFPGGRRIISFSGIAFGTFENFGAGGYFWSSTRIDEPGYTWIVYWFLKAENHSLARGNNDTRAGMSVRCIRD
jgi:uncharacterized protein (TIGR02145 family)